MTAPVDTSANEVNRLAALICLPEVAMTRDVTRAAATLRALVKERDAAQRRLDVEAMANDECVKAIVAIKAERDALRAALEKAEQINRVAAGCISTTPDFADKHPEEALRFITDAALARSAAT